MVSGVRVDNERKSATGGSSADEGVRPTMARSCEGKGYYAAGLYATASISTLMPGTANWQAMVERAGLAWPKNSA